MEHQMSKLQGDSYTAYKPSTGNFESEDFSDEENHLERNRASFKAKDVWASDGEDSEDDEKAGKGVKWGEDVVQNERPAELKKMGTGMIGSQAGQKNMVGA
jgi:hypothetical protein